MSQTKPLSYRQRRTNYQEQNGTDKLTSRQEQRLRKTQLRAEHRTPKQRRPVVRQRAAMGRKRWFATKMREHYATLMRERRRTNPNARPGRATARRQP